MKSVYTCMLFGSILFSTLGLAGPASAQSCENPGTCTCGQFVAVCKRSFPNQVADCNKTTAVCGAACASAKKSGNRTADFIGTVTGQARTARCN